PSRQRGAYQALGQLETESFRSCGRCDSAAGFRADYGSRWPKACETRIPEFLRKNRPREQKLPDCRLAIRHWEPTGKICAYRLRPLQGTDPIGRWGASCRAVAVDVATSEGRPAPPGLPVDDFGQFVRDERREPHIPGPEAL